MKRLIISLILFINLIALNAQIAVNEYLQDNLFYIFDENIHSLQLYPEGIQTADPVIRLGYNEKLTCSFDDFDFVGKNYNYTVYHCDPDWKITENINRNDYMSGYYHEDYIRDYTSSFNTLRNYMHYSFDFPNENLNISLSGNYALVVYEENVDKPSFIARFYVTEDAVTVSTNIGFSKNPEFLQSKQRVAFTINTSNYRITDPYKDLLVFVTQNDRQYSKQGNIQPISIMGNSIVYDFQDKFEFNGNNEFRYLDIRNVKTLTKKIYSIKVDKGEYNILLDAETTFKGKPHTTNFDLNGKFSIEVKDAENANVEAEYAFVYFTLFDKIPFHNTDVYICGNFNGWKLEEENIMSYNYEKGYYEGCIYLKQGYYNYTYLAKRNDTGIILESEMDGSYVETKNDYKILVYYINPGEYYYKLLSYTVASSN
ncbi:DUF5103 domain-containing protein [Odoribacter sp. OttesenSCG-928-L07]|nr:DUF5103 domain-containing protein [Odoribacter sp. OttesenSCG-928-L07]